MLVRGLADRMRVGGGLGRVWACGEGAEGAGAGAGEEGVKIQY